MANSKISKAFKAALVSSVLVASPVPLSNVATASYGDQQQPNRRERLLSALQSALEKATAASDENLIKELKDLIDKVGDSQKTKANQLSKLESTVKDLVKRANGSAQPPAPVVQQPENGDNQYFTSPESDIFINALPPRPETVQPAEAPVVQQPQVPAEPQPQIPAELQPENNDQPAENGGLDNSEVIMENEETPSETTANQSPSFNFFDSPSSGSIAHYSIDNSSNDSLPTGSPINSNRANSILYHSEGSAESLAVSNDQLPETPAELNPEESSGSNTDFTENDIKDLSIDKEGEELEVHAEIDFLRYDRHFGTMENQPNDSPLTNPADQQPEEETQNEPHVELQAENTEEETQNEPELQDQVDTQNEIPVQPANEIIEEEDSSSSPTSAFNENADEQHNEEEAPNETVEDEERDEQRIPLEEQVRQLREQLNAAHQEIDDLRAQNEELQNYAIECNNACEDATADVDHATAIVREIFPSLVHQQPASPVAEQNENNTYQNSNTQTDVTAEQQAQLEARVQRLQEQLTEANKKINNLNAKNTDLEIVIKTKTECLEEQNKAKIEDVLKINKQEDQIQSLQKELDKAKQKLGAAEEAKQRAELSAKAKEEEAKNMANEKESSLKNEIQKLKDQINALQEQLQEQLNEATQNEQQINDLRAQINALNLRLSQAQNNQVECQGTQPLPPANDQADTQNETPVQPANEIIEEDSSSSPTSALNGNPDEQHNEEVAQNEAEAQPEEGTQNETPAEPQPENQENQQEEYHNEEEDDENHSEQTDENSHNPSQPVRTGNQQQSTTTQGGFWASLRTIRASISSNIHNFLRPLSDSDSEDDSDENLQTINDATPTPTPTPAMPTPLPMPLIDSQNLEQHPIIRVLSAVFTFFTFSLFFGNSK